MLKHLSIKNYALIQHLEMDFGPGFSVITGETGAGKSILLGALGLVLGDRSDTTVLLDKKSKCVVESHFLIGGYGLQDFFAENELDYDEISILRREINPHGKSRGFINDTPVNLNLLKELGEKLVNIHSQHQTITLNDSNFQLAVIDQYAGLHQQINEYKALHLDFTAKHKIYHELVEQENKSKTDQDYLHFQLIELEKAALKADEQEKIEKELEILNNAGEIKTTLSSSMRLLITEENNILNQLSEINLSLEKLGPVHEDISVLQQRLDSTIIELDDIAREIEKLEQDIQVDPQRADELNARLDLIFQLQHKHHLQTVEELIQATQHIREQIESITSLGEHIETLSNEIAEARKVLLDSAEIISEERQKAIPELSEEIIEIVKGLGMPDADVSIDHNRVEEPGKDGLDNVVFMFNSNKGGTQKEISKIASGGELSRLMLAIKSLISTRNLLPTIIFDEIDAGVSGDIAGKVGKILKSMSGQMQVIVITHLPQIAGKGDHHFMVFKDTSGEKALTQIKKLDAEGRVEEIAKLLSDEQVTRSAVDTARELLGTTRN